MSKIAKRLTAILLVFMLSFQSMTVLAEESASDEEKTVVMESDSDKAVSEEDESGDNAEMLTEAENDGNDEAAYAEEEELSSLAGNSIGKATSISLGRTYSGAITSSNEKDFYKFTISSSGDISLTSTSYIPSVYYKLYDSNGESLWSSFYRTNSSGQCGISETFDLTKGTYYLGIERYHDVGNYSFKLSFSSAGESFTETGNGINNTIATASNISTGTTYKGQIALNDEKDFYKFTISSSGKISLTSTSYISSVYYRLYDSNGESLWSSFYRTNSSGQSDISEIFDLTKGTYYLGIETNNNAGNYSFKIAPHQHSYTQTITKATTYRNGLIKGKCSCGQETSSIIYYPKTVSLSTTKYTYDGSERTPIVVVKGSNGKVISPSNYTVFYSDDRKNVGKYTVIVNFEGNYTGSISRTFVINPKATSISKLKAKSKAFTVQWKKQTTQVSGYQIQYSTSKSFSKKATKTIAKNTTSSATYKKLSGKKKYYVRIRTYKTVMGTKYYSAWSSAKSVTTKK